jgi:hypothetical protein
MPKDHHPHRWIVNNEKTMPVKEAGKLIEQLSAKLQESGQFKLNGVPIALPENCHFVMRHERRPKGELVLKTELVWHPETDIQGETSDEFMISDD